MKPWAYAIILLVLVGAIGAVYAKGHSAGYDKRDNEVQQEILEAQELARSEEEQKWAAVVRAAEENIRTEEVIVERIRVVEKEIPKVVREIIEIRPECRDLGDSYAGLLNDQIRAANRIPISEVAPGVVD